MASAKTGKRGVFGLYYFPNEDWLGSAVRSEVITKSRWSKCWRVDMRTPVSSRLRFVLAVCALPLEGVRDQPLRRRIDTSAKATYGL